ncbi:bifunctional alpha/beta hydrolase/OsmC family protein [Natronospira bacteriovora]|uniref:Bifunctional alpha/beta hydrolase/OsmC family protein n=1 Tax=Natronospira bacteriovora TaxID=3069753 RepID=A0ABU0W6U3_9GAMM|nr:bifunctional alpha/beta hydrolase/OsmC family protein [Natronospira sp. AB-CW4]MDQ2069753.1 bifunctional alpha/beta hydrolase/OsmC family protein [Natronospira sp. AB-CW4]
MARESFEFDGGQGQRLSGVIENPRGEPRGWAVFAHCFTCGSQSVGAVAISRSLAARGIGVLRFDFTGLGESEGAFGRDGIGGDIEDIKAAVRAMDESGRSVALLIGHSLGGAAVLHAAGDLDGVRAVTTLGAPADPAHVLHLLGDQRDTIESEGVAEVHIGGRPFNIHKGFIRGMENRPWRERIAALRKPLLVMHAPLDDIVEIENAAEIFLAAKHPKSFVSLDEADHLLSRRRDADWAAEVISAWSGRYLTAGNVGDEVERGVEPGEGVRTITQGSGFLSHVRAGRHSLIADEPANVGGSDQGPTPYDLLGAALGSCTGMTLAMYARHKQWSLEQTDVQVSHDRIHARDCEDCEKEEGKVDRFTRTIRIKGKLDSSQRQRLLEIADRCPVHRTLENEIRIETRLDEA